MVVHGKFNCTRKSRSLGITVPPINKVCRDVVSYEENFGQFNMEFATKCDIIMKVTCNIKTYLIFCMSLFIKNIAVLINQREHNIYLKLRG